MDIIIVSHRQGRTWRFAVQPRALLTWLPVACGIVALCATGFAAGYTARGSGDSVVSSALFDTMRSELDDEQSRVEAASSAAQQEARALARHIAEIQARVTRLDAAGQRLTELAGLEEGEFDFANAPAVGGPELSGESSAASLASALLALDDAQQVIGDRERQLRVLEDLLLVSRVQDDVRPSGWPVHAGYVSSGYGYRTDPLNGRRSYHPGIDFAGPAGTDVLAVASGIVQTVKVHPSYGKMIEINHGNGYVTRYAHNRKLLVEVGQRVVRGQPIAQMGSTGRSTGNHCHLEVMLNGRTVNPAQYINDRASS